jgi:hypothetical protein
VANLGAGNRKKIDWEAISREYRAGIRSLRDIGNEYGVTEGAIRKRAKAEEWPRDLSEQIKAKADDLVRKEAVRNGTIGTQERTVVATNAQMQADAILQSRKDIQRYMTLGDSLITEVEAQTANPELFEQLGELLQSPDEKGMDKLNEIYRKVISTNGRVETFKKLAETYKTLIGLKRQAFGIADNADGDKPQDTIKTLSPNEAARRVAFLLLSQAKEAKE